MMLKQKIFFVFCVLCFLCGKAMALSKDIVILTQSDRIFYQVEVADTPELLQKGLMKRESMPHNHGMLFVFEGTKPVFMWMKNTYIPLDMLFLDKEGIVRHIHENAKPFDETIISSPQPVKYVIELNAGQVQKNHIQIGNKVKDIQ